MGNKFRTLAILFILIGLPAFAWYFLNKGTDLRKEAMQALKVKSTLGNFEVPTEKDVIVKPDLLKGKRWLIAVLGNTDQRLHDADILNKLYKQSKDEFLPQVLCITGLVTGETMPGSSQLFRFPSDNNNWLICYMSSDHIFPFAKDAFNIPEKYSKQSCVILLDEYLNIRNYYSLNDEDDLKQLVRHYPVFLSLKNKQDGK